MGTENMLFPINYYIYTCPMKLFILILFTILFVEISHAGPPTTILKTENESHTILTDPIYLFQDFLSAADGDRCPMTPSCSTYALEATRKHGILIGWIMACDRLLRCGRDELNNRPPKWTRNGIRCPDSVEDNDFWWQ